MEKGISEDVKALVETPVTHTHTHTHTLNGNQCDAKYFLINYSFGLGIIKKIITKGETCSCLFFQTIFFMKSSGIFY